MYEESVFLGGNIDSLHTCLAYGLGIIILSRAMALFMHTVLLSNKLNGLLIPEGCDYLLADYIREYVKGECGNSAMGRKLYENHLILVAHYGISCPWKQELILKSWNWPPTSMISPL